MLGVTEVIAVAGKDSVPVPGTTAEAVVLELGLLTDMSVQAVVVSMLLVGVTLTGSAGWLASLVLAGRSVQDEVLPIVPA